MKRILPVLFLLLGLGLLAGSGFAVWKELQFRNGAVEADGQIVEMLARSSRRDGRTSTSYLPVFVFSLPDGTKRRVEGGVSSNPPCCTVGERVRVRYRPDTPEQAQMTGFMESWFVATLLGAMGLVFTLVGSVVWGAMRRGGGAAAMAGATPMTMGGASPMGMPVQGPANAMTFQVPLAGLRRVQGPGGMQWIVQARWSDPRSGVTRLFESLPLPFDPVPQMRTMSSVAVTFDPGDPHSPYAFDLSFLRAPGTGQTGAVVRNGT
ncbi:DUF3592 domain-containing protein [Roseomonas sp. HJA6]|uniref:DUF3592 domain-containing protein n=1 Tax=Roseomonas alba TaxID=2846776 RepID=A0ABS7A5B2_9PROT|nr:DUF3592 domain-containing protein [Neoroseomonas alba]MBW6397446.1 DUF3592 domain-containing protein [Neoroseomonas alba]